MKLTISLAQINVDSNNLAATFDKGAKLIVEAKRRDSDIVVLPEMWTTGFDWELNATIYQEQVQVIEQIAQLAKQHKIWILGSMLAPNKNNKPANTAIMFNHQGKQVAVYRKTHLFSFVGEDKHLHHGEKLTTVTTPWGTAGLSICYDVRFPELYRSYALQGAQFIFMPSAFPYPRLEHYKTLIRARAIENQLFMIACNHVGIERKKEEEINFFGHSCIVDPWGKTIIEAGDSFEGLLTATIDLSETKKIRELMQVFQDRRTDLY